MDNSSLSSQYPEGIVHDARNPLVWAENEDFLPTRAHAHDAGYDLRSTKKVVLKPFERCLIPTGVKMAVPQNMVADIRPRSGLAHKHGITVLNSPGTIDSGYRGEVMVNIINLSHEDYTIEEKDKIAQVVFTYINTECKYAQYGLPESVDGRDSAGHGSSGVK